MALLEEDCGDDAPARGRLAAGATLVAPMEGAQHVGARRIDSQRAPIRAAKRLTATPLALAYGAGPLSMGLIWVLRALRVVANLPFLLYLALWLGGTAASTIANVNYDRHPSRRALNLRVASHAAATTVIIYSIGWGPVLGLVYAFTAQENIAQSGPSTWRIAVLWDCLCIAIAQMGVAFGLVPSFLPTPEAHGAAFLGAAALVCVARMAGTTAAETERAAASVRTSEERLRTIIETANEAYVELDEAGVVTDWNAQAEATFGWSPQEAEGRRLEDLIVPPASLGGLRRKLAGVGAAVGTAPGSRLETFALRRNGSEIPVELAIWTTMTAGGRRLHFFVHDISDRKRAEDALRDSEASFRLLFDRNPHPMWVHEVETLSFVAVNDAAIERYGYSRSEFLAMRITDIRPPEDAVALASDTLRVQDGVRHAGVWRHLTKSGRVMDVEVTSHLLAFSGRQCSLVLAQDVTERLRDQRNLVHQAMHDALTGLPNRSLLVDRLNQAVARSDRNGGRVAAIFVDLDRFKIINDAKGHATGDHLLLEVATRMQSAVRPGDTVARIGGDEFVVVVEGVADQAQAAATGSRIGWALDAPFIVDDCEFFVSASQGIALAERGETADEVLARADAAMYFAKERGGARTELATEAVRARASKRLELESALRQAVDNEEFVLHYQPIIEVATGGIVGAEALVRWRQPDGTLWAPIRFIPAAEESGLIVPIGEWVLHRALRDARQWERAAPDGRPLSVAVNLSATQLSVPNLPFVLARALSSAQVDPSQLHLEITESVLMRDIDHVVTMLTALRETGIRVDVDDFGTGYSSLMYVQRLPVDTLKIDKSFIDRLDGSDQDASIVQAVINIGRSLDLDIIAEGVETEHQHAVLQALGCRLAQGFRFARPLPAGPFAELLAGGPLPHRSQTMVLASESMGTPR